MTTDKTSDEIQAEAYGELARAYKKLIPLSTRELGGAYGILARAFKKLRARHTQTAEAVVYRAYAPPISHVDFLTGLPEWDFFFNHYLYDQIVAPLLRADRFKNFWLKDASVKKGWRPIPEGDFKDAFRQVKAFHEVCTGLMKRLQYSKDAWEKDVGYVTQRRWSSRHFISCAATPSYPNFYVACKENHLRLGSLRGGKKAK
jgi:hypothetical protein